MRRLLKIIAFIMISIIILLICARYIGTYGLVTKEYKINSSEIPEEFDGIKIVHFSDLHYKRAISNDKVEDVIKEINLINPDIVVFTGDLFDEDNILSDNDYNFIANSLNKINAKYGKYAILGNHDFKDKDNIINIYNQSGFNYLENNMDTIQINNSKINISGIGNVTYNEDDISKINLSNDAYNIILVHEPDIIDDIVNNEETDLILAGHSHNGQVRIPFIGAIVKPEGAKKYYDEYYKINNTDIYISSGIGVSILNYRLFNHPSINFYRINKK